MYHGIILLIYLLILLLFNTFAIQIEGLEIYENFQGLVFFKESQN